MEDYIDFPVSDTWLDWYNSIGLTPRHSGRLTPTERYLLERIERLESMLVELLELLKEERCKSSRAPRIELPEPKVDPLAEEG